MNDTKKISVVINTYNAERHLLQVINAAKGFDEIVVCDMESTDNTLDIAKGMGCRVVTFEKKDHNIVEPARQFAIEQASFPWVLVLDADEIVSEATNLPVQPHLSAGMRRGSGHSAQELFHGEVHACLLSRLYFAFL